MTTPAKVEVNDETKDVLGALAQGDPDLLAAGLELRANWKAKSGLDGRSYALVKLAALIGRASCRKECRSRWSPYH